MGNRKWEMGNRNGKWKVHLGNKKQGNEKKGFRKIGYQEMDK